ncbi:hypothetical protein GC167_02225 [bacterium]|nr:hypothetical protein [bacterium]
MRIGFPGLIGLMFAGGVACSTGSSEPEDTRVPVARVYQQYLYLDQIDSLIEPGTSVVDSADRVRQYIDRWARDRILLAKAEYNLSEEDKDFSALLQEYRNDLLKYSFQQAMLRQYLDTVVTEAQIEAFYKTHKEDFALKENIVLADWMVLSSRTPQLEQAKKWFFSDATADQNRIRDYALKYSTRYALDDTNWTRFSDLVLIIPVQTYNQQQFLQSNRRVELRDSTQTYWLKLRDYRMVDGSSPLSYVRETVKSILLNERKLALIQHMEQDLIEEALMENDYEVFTEGSK